MIAFNIFSRYSRYSMNLITKYYNTEFNGWLLKIDASIFKTHVYINTQDHIGHIDSNGDPYVSPSFIPIIEKSSKINIRQIEGVDNK